MLKRSLWMSALLLLTSAIALSSCGQPAPQPSGGTTVVSTASTATTSAQTTEAMPTTSAPTTSAEPQYGGTINEPYTIAQMGGWEPASYTVPMTFAYGVYEGLLMEDWAKGPSGTNAFPLASGYTPGEGYTGCLAESWEQPDLSTLVFHLRKGINFQNKLPVNGRQVTSADVVYSFNRCQSFVGSEWYLAPDKADQKIIVTALDQWTVQFKLPSPDPFKPLSLSRDLMVFPREVVDKYGDFTDWKNACGTGPWMPTDVVPGSSVTYAKNPNYWQFDPLHPKNQLPYADELRRIWVTDVQTQLAALRTGKLERLITVSWSDAANLHKDTPRLAFRKLAPTGTRLGPMRIDVAPFNDKRVRQALMMAINWDDMVDNFYGGNAERLTWPLLSTATGIYTPPEELPAADKQLYEYHPDLAKELLKEAGYPSGFTFNVITQQAYVDQAQLVTAYWEEVGVTAQIDVKEAGTQYSMEMSRTYSGMSMGGWGNSQPWLAVDTAYKPGHLWNTSGVDDAYVTDTWAKIRNTLDKSEQTKMWKDLNIYLIDQMYYLNFPAPMFYTFWQPWLQGYSGEFEVGRLFDYVGVLTYVWIDLPSKRAVTGTE